MAPACLLECRGRVEPGQRLGRRLGAPTANLCLRDAAGVGFGTFAAVVEGLDRPYRAVAHVGVRPSVSVAGPLVLEVHLLDFDGDLYGREVTVKLEHKVTDEVRLDSLDALTAKIAADVAAVRDYFAAHDVRVALHVAGEGQAGRPRIRAEAPAATG